jgi:hypothetical protein
MPDNDLGRRETKTEFSHTVEENRGTDPKARRYLIGFPIIMIIYLGLIFLYIYPHRPIDVVGWLILIFVGIPINLLVEWIGERVFSHRIGQELSDKRTSVKRIIVALFVILALIGFFSVVWLAFSSLIRQHFS